MYYCSANDSDGLIRLLLKKCIDTNQKVVIIPDSDFSAKVIDDNQERLKKYFLFPHIYNSPGAVGHWMRKSKQKQLAVEVGMNVALGQVVTIENHNYTLPPAIVFPCFTKPLVSVGGGKQFFCRCNNERELQNVFDKVCSFRDMDMLVEDFKIINKEYAVVGFSDGNNVVVPGVIEFISNSESHFGIAREGLVKPITGFEELIDLFEEYLRRIGFCGLFDIDFFESDGVLYFGEINLRFGGSGYAVTKMGVNLPVMMIKFLRGESYSDMPQHVTSTASFANERMCLDDWYYNYLSSEELDDIINSVDVLFVKDEEDPGPYRAFKKECIKRIIKRGIRQKLRKI